MSVSFSEFIYKTGAEVVCGNLIVGQQSNRKVVGSVLDGSFSLNEHGQALLNGQDLPSDPSPPSNLGDAVQSPVDAPVETEKAKKRGRPKKQTPESEPQPVSNSDDGFDWSLDDIAPAVNVD